MDIDVNAVRWEDVSDEDAKPGSRLLATLSFSGVSHHLEALEVEDRNGLQLTVDGHWDDTLGDYYEASGADGPFSTVDISGRTYVLVMTPFCA